MKTKRGPFDDRKTAPTAALGYVHDAPLTFRVWTQESDFEGSTEYRCAAAFQYLRDCLDYIAQLQDGGHDCIFQSPADCRPILATDRRAVYRDPAPATV